MRVYGFKESTFGFMEIENSLEAEQAFVGGYIDVVSIGNGIDLVCNDEGKMNGSSPSVAWVEGDDIVDIVFGDFFLCRSKDGEFISINDEDVKYIKEKLKIIIFSNGKGMIALG